MKIDVQFSESTTIIPMQFSGLHIVTNGVPPDEVDKRVADAESNGVQIGKKAQYDDFWDSFQENGNRTDYSHAFRNWKDDIFFPKYDIVLAGTTSNAFQNTKITDLKDKLDKQGVKLDTSNCTRLLQMFQGAAVRHIPALDMRRVMNASYAFGSNCEVETIDMLTVSESTVFSETTFHAAEKLRNITFAGTVGVSVDLHWSPLTADSMKSLLTHLKDYSGTDKAYVYTVTFSDACWALLEAEGTAAPGGITWRRFADRLGWNT